MSLFFYAQQSTTLPVCGCIVYNAALLSSASRDVPSITYTSATSPCPCQQIPFVNLLSPQPTPCPPPHHYHTPPTLRRFGVWFPPQVKLAISHALAQSTLLGCYEERLQVGGGGAGTPLGCSEKLASTVVVHAYACVLVPAPVTGASCPFIFHSCLACRTWMLMCLHRCICASVVSTCMFQLGT
jgi:hypothetical protein